MNILLDLFLTFAKIGLFTFGGGYAMISMIENNCVERKQWITHDEIHKAEKPLQLHPCGDGIAAACFLRILLFHDFQHHSGTQLKAILEYQAICDGLMLSYTIRVLLKQFFLLVRHGGLELFFVPTDQLH